MLVHRKDATRIAIVPIHKGRTLPPGTLRAILKGARITVENLRALP
jgi:predicted RNA binding protein YcfA (HicA-like mRNA interferase family)